MGGGVVCKLSHTSTHTTGTPNHGFAKASKQMTPERPARNWQMLAEPIQTISTEGSTEAADEVKSAPTSEPQSVKLRRIINQLEDERWTLVLESRKWDEAQKDYEEFYEDDLDDQYD